ncbi:MAG TPA: MFS transporter [Intrasporangium sp.]|uniref:MFS transporter n=1 Tax=Intrasporangium sp. TaxID=1925024 RepID=UPI002D776EFF|nr:MFS transporter [Intrasporangium sp.]HET7398881.1 MFS transporter [Intrasporangium sp.]
MDSQGEPSEPQSPGPRPPLGRSRWETSRALGRGVGRAAAGGGRLAARGGRLAARTFRGYVAAGGADESGLARVTELHASHTAGDAAMALALAGTLFFSPTTTQARSQVALFLLVAMVPFLLVAPLLGPLLDRVGHGRRWVIGATLAARGFLSWVLAEGVTTHSNWLFPAALAYLVASKTYNVTRAAAVPRVLPQGMTLMTANSRSSVAGIVGAMAGGALAGAALRFGPEWALRVTFVVFVVATVQAIRLPARVDSSAGELRPEDAPVGAGPGAGTPPPTPRRRPGAPAGRLRRRVHAVPWPVLHALWSTGGTRLLTGFLILFMAFLARERPIDGMDGRLALGLVVVALGVGNVLGSALGNVLKDHRPERVAMLSVLLAFATCVAAAVWYGAWTLVALGLVQGLSAQLAKVCFDALVQREVREDVRTSVFAWAETVLLVLWVLGGGLGIVLPLNPHVGFPVVAAALLGTVVLAARTRAVGAPARPRPMPRAA